MSLSYKMKTAGFHTVNRWVRYARICNCWQYILLIINIQYCDQGVD